MILTFLHYSNKTRNRKKLASVRAAPTNASYGVLSDTTKINLLRYSPRSKIMLNHVQPPTNRSVPSASFLRQAKHKPRYRMSAVVLLRVFSEDKVKHTFREVWEWMEWMFYGGVEHIFVYDNWHQQDESIATCLQPYVSRGLVTYHDFNHPGKTYAWIQASAYAHWLQTHRQETLWQMTLDFDEYPHIHGDTDAGFLQRITEKSACAVYFQNQFWIDVKQNKSNGEWLIERYVRRDKNFERYPSRSKVLYNVAHVTKLLVHSVEMQGCSDHHIIPIQEGALEHYWGHRHVGGNPEFDLKAFTRNTIGPDTRMRDAARKFKALNQARITHAELPSTCAVSGW